MFASLGAYGHLYPMMPLALACADAGHETVIATGPPFLERLPLPTVPGIRSTSSWTGRSRGEATSSGYARSGLQHGHVR